MPFLSGLQGRLQRHSQTSRVDQLEQQLQMLAAQTEVLYVLLRTHLILESKF